MKIELGRQLRLLRKAHFMTKEQFAGSLQVSCQTVSDWETDRGQPDLPMLAGIAERYHCSLDTLVFGRGGAAMGSAVRPRVSAAVLLGLLEVLLGVGCIAIKAVSVEYVDAAGVLHENFFLIPMGGLFFLAGLFTLLACVVRRCVGWHRRELLS